MDFDLFDASLILLLGLLLGFAFGISIYTGLDDSVILNQETADNICQQLTNNQTAIATSEQGKLICELPSFDSTQNIIVRNNNQD